MSRQFHFFDQPRRFVVGTVGQPGERTFFLQASDDGRVVSVALEKAQVLVLAERMEQLLVEMSGRAGVELPDEVVPDTDPLESPIDEEFRVAAMGLAYDTDSGLIVIEAQAPGGLAGAGRIHPARGHRRGTGRAAGPAGAPGGGGIRGAGPPGDQRRPAAVPAVQPAAGRPGPHLPAQQRLPPPGAVGIE